MAAFINVIRNYGKKLYTLRKGCSDTRYRQLHQLKTGRGVCFLSSKVTLFSQRASHAVVDEGIVAQVFRQSLLRIEADFETERFDG